MDLRRGTLGITLFLFILGCTNALNAQLNRGSIEGTVVDPQGGVVPGAAPVASHAAPYTVRESPAARSDPRVFAREDGAKASA